MCALTAKRWGICAMAEIIQVREEVVADARANAKATGGDNLKDELRKHLENGDTVEVVMRDGSMRSFIDAKEFSDWFDSPL
jgi:hypothetical protein